ncbi:class F sortase [Corynebacterium guaraldiae]|uniref:class F sortase n=1 Tax=Corynebacterium TaxID=1716 RepID=UPI0008A4101F|nr:MULTISPECIES: class F sortase [Corynebacterium]OFM31880.1 peptidase C60 [Corynebacterium sp. HMSC072A02]TRX32714.1 class F sortase [Corynebacterium guaraldiae]
MADESQQNDIPEYPADSTGEAAGETAAGKHRAGEEQAAGESKKGNKKLLIGLVALIAIILVIVQLVIYAGRNGDDSAEDNAGDSAETSQSSESAAPTTNNDPFVDDSGEQDQEIDAAPGEFRGFGAMSLGINDEFAAVDPIQVTDTGMLIPPRDVQRLGWYSASAVPGEAGPVGSSVITGHINYQGQGTGFAEKFTTLEQGQEFTVFIDGEERQFRVTEAPYRLPKGSGFPDVVNDAQGDNRLVLITCGGKFVGGELGYEDNIITVAEPVAPVEGGAEAPVDGAVDAPAEGAVEAPAA